MAPEKHLLIVEDNPATRSALKALLEREVYRVACAANGREALEYLQRAELPCVILLDLNMPVMDGWEFRQRQRADPGLAHIAVVVVSSEENLPQVAASLGAAGYAHKPVEFAELLQNIRCLSGEVAD
jgi:CheY-like chemotaxis protein